MKKFFIKTLGCKTNQLENEIIINELLKIGYEQTDNAEEADIYIMNSCAVTENATTESLYYLKNIKHKNKNIKTILTGCAAQLKDFDTKNEYIDLVLGNNEKLEIGKYIENNGENVNDILNLKNFNNKFIHSHTRTRANLKIQDGCNNRCTYCTIPFARGNSRSNSVENIIKQIGIYSQNGINEVILTGIHIGQWGLDFQEKMSLKDLLEKIEKTDIKRYRLGSLDPLELNDELLNFLKNSQKFCPHFHISIQSMSNATLKRMNRKYSATKTLEVIEKINTLFTKPFIGCDIIVGFSGETGNDFEECFKNLEIANISKIHVFPYSKRRNTAAFSFPDEIDDDTKRKRADLLKKLSSVKYYNFLEENIGTVQEVQVQKKIDKKTGLYKGTTRNYIDVYIDSQNDITNQILNVKLVKVLNDRVYGKLV